MKRKLPKSARIFIRKEKARIRKEVASPEKRRQLILGLISGCGKNYENK